MEWRCKIPGNILAIYYIIYITYLIYIIFLGIEVGKQISNSVCILASVWLHLISIKLKCPTLKKEINGIERGQEFRNLERWMWLFINTE